LQSTNWGRGVAWWYSTYLAWARPRFIHGTPKTNINIRRDNRLMEKKENSQPEAHVCGELVFDTVGITN
jgi:hypothetical protein